MSISIIIERVVVNRVGGGDHGTVAGVDGKRRVSVRELCFVVCLNKYYYDNFDSVVEYCMRSFIQSLYVYSTS
jgi:hypothetical protein